MDFGINMSTSSIMLLAFLFVGVSPFAHAIAGTRHGSVLVPPRGLKECDMNWNVCMILLLYTEDARVHHKWHTIPGFTLGIWH